MSDVADVLRADDPPGLWQGQNHVAKIVDLDLDLLRGLGVAQATILRVAMMALASLGIGLTTPSATALAMDPVPHLAGTASAAVGSLQMTSGAIAGYLTTKIGSSSPLVFADVVIAMAVLAFAATTRAATTLVR